MMFLSKNWYFSVPKSLNLLYRQQISPPFILLVFPHVANFRYVANFRFLTLTRFQVVWAKFQMLAIA